jgi:hypothetical protein
MQQSDFEGELMHTLNQFEMAGISGGGEEGVGVFRGFLGWVGIVTTAVDIGRGTMNFFEAMGNGFPSYNGPGLCMAAINCEGYVSDRMDGGAMMP